MAETAIIETSSGKLCGAPKGGVHIFRGIPYAAPPLGRSRFAAPQPLQPWPGVREATEYGARAIQPATGLGLPAEIGSLLVLSPPQPMSEDCLFLNIWTPALDQGRRPVMVWLHGGAFVTGSGGSLMYDGTNLAEREDVVVVTLNHRLGLLGYLHLAPLGEAFADSGNAGMLDIIAALRWLRENIARFGGDPGNVTIFGESGGGAKVCVLMAMPAAQGLFHKAIVQSGPAVEMMRPEDAGAVRERVLTQLGLDPKRSEALLDISADALLEAQMVEMRRRGPLDFANRRRLGFNPVIDDRNLPRPPFDPDAPAISAQVPLMIGTNKDEMALFWALAPWLEGLDDAGLLRLVRELAGERAEAIVAAYRHAQPKASPRDLFTAIGSDQGMRLPSLTIAERKTAQQAAPVFVYLFTWETPALDGRLKSAHALEIPFVFDTVARATALTGTAPARLALARSMSAAWAQFARSGNPNHARLPQWPAYAGDQRPTMIFDETCRLERDPLGAERRVWS